jgi:molybdopterin-binding protein
VDAGRLTTTSASGRRRSIDGAALADFARQLAPAPGAPHGAGESARNRFEGIVTRVVKDTVMAQVEVQAGPFRVVSLISREAVEELRLAAGVAVVAAVKATNVVLELPHSG